MIKKLFNSRYNGKTKLILKTLFYEILLLFFVSSICYLIHNFILFLILIALSLFYSIFLYEKLVFNIALNVHDRYHNLFEEFKKEDTNITHLNEMIKEIDEYLEYYKSAIKNYLPTIYDTRCMVLGYINLHSNKCKI